MLFIGWSKFLSRHYQSEALNRCGIHTSSVWNFCARSSEVIRGETSGGSTKCRLFSSGYDWSSGGQKLIFFKIWEKKIVTVTFGRQIFCIWNFEGAKTTVRCCGCKIPVIQKVVFFFNPQAKTSNPPQKIFNKLLWREFFFTVGSQLPESPEMVNNPLSLQIPWEESAEYLERWKQVSNVRRQCYCVDLCSSW